MKELTIELSYACLADCIMCARKQTSRNQIYMSVENYMKYLEYVIDAGYDAIIFGGMGEPLLNPCFSEIVRYTRMLSTEIYIRLATTGCNMTGDNADIIAEYINEVKISYYGVTERIYRQVHRGNLDYIETKNNIFSLIERNRKCHITMNFLDLPVNHSEYSEWKKQFGKYDNVSLDYWKPHNWGGNMDFETDNKHFLGCSRVNNRNITVWSDGLVSACCFDVKRSLIIGDLNHKSLLDIFDSNAWKAVEKMHYSYDSIKGTACKNCDQIWDRKDSLIDRVVRKNSLLIPARGNGFGFFAEVRNTLTGLVYARQYDLEPSIYWGKNFGYRDDDDEINWYTKYFYPVGDERSEPKEGRYNQIFGREEASVVNKKYGSSGYAVTEKMIDVYTKAWSEYVKLNDPLQKQFDEYWNTICTGNDVLIGIHMRGADFRKGYEKHPRFIDVSEYINEAGTLISELRSKNADVNIGIFVATDDQRMLSEFLELSDEKVFYSNARRTDTNETLYFSKIDTMSELCCEVLLDAYVLSKCQYLISGRSQVMYMSKVWKKSRGETYKKHIQIDKGLNETSSNSHFVHGKHKKTYYSLGGCDIQRCISFLANDNTEVYFETSPFYGNARGMNTGTEYIRSCFEFSDFQKQFCIDHFSNYREERAFKTKMFDRIYDYVIITFSDDGLADLWRAKSTPDLVIIGANRDGNPRVKYRVDTEKEFDEFGEAKEWFLDVFENIGRISMERLRSNLSFIRKKLNSQTTMILIGGNEYPYYRRGEPHNSETIEQIGKINHVIKEFSNVKENNSIYIDINDLCNRDDSFCDLVYHWTSTTAYKIANRIYEKTANQVLPLVDIYESRRNFHSECDVYKPTLVLFGTLVSALKDEICNCIGDKWNVVENDMKCSLVSVCDDPIDEQLDERVAGIADIRKNVRKELHRSDIEYVVLDHFYTAYAQKLLRISGSLFTYSEKLYKHFLSEGNTTLDNIAIEQVDIDELDIEKSIQRYIDVLNQQYGNKHIILLGVSISDKSTCSAEKKQNIQRIADEIDGIICKNFDCTYFPESIKVEISEREDGYRIIGAKKIPQKIVNSLHRLTDGIR